MASWDLSNKAPVMLKLSVALYTIPGQTPSPPHLYLFLLLDTLPSFGYHSFPSLYQIFLASLHLDSSSLMINLPVNLCEVFCSSSSNLDLRKWSFASFPWQIDLQVKDCMLNALSPCGKKITWNIVSTEYTEKREFGNIRYEEDTIISKLEPWHYT